MLKMNLEKHIIMEMASRIMSKQHTGSLKLRKKEFQKLNSIWLVATKRAEVFSLIIPKLSFGTLKLLSKVLQKLNII